jgi:hypothetical protein
MRPCEWENESCANEATMTVETVLGRRRYCGKHGTYVRMVEREWDQAEAELYEAPVDWSDL